ncbi:hypothetical protein H9P43_004081 [Blastocladiella emersonii ATCC 22665]|nr:hypothetical protein H9P43_004081 [Blastocladiella emersonii ATCC 22665]
MKPSHSMKQPPAAPPAAIPCSPDVVVEQPEYFFAAYAEMASANYDVNAEWTIATRYFNPHFFINRTTEGVDLDRDQMVMQSPNGLCIVSFAPTHPIYAHAARTGATVASVTYTELASTNVMRKARNNVMAKRKRVARDLPPGGTGDYTFFPHVDIGEVTLSDGSVWPFAAAVHGTILSLNDAAANGGEPQIVLDHALNRGFLVIIKPTAYELRQPVYLPLAQFAAVRPALDVSRFPDLVGPRDTNEEEEEEEERAKQKVQEAAAASKKSTADGSSDAGSEAGGDE